MYRYSAGAPVCNATQPEKAFETKAAPGAPATPNGPVSDVKERVRVSKALAVKCRPAAQSIKCPSGQQATRRTMRSAAIALALVLLAGCETAVTRQAAVDNATRSTHLLLQEPHRAAVCIARNIDRDRSALLAQIRPGTAPVVIEVHVRADELVALAQLLISGEGSTAVIWITPDPLYRDDRLVHVMIAGC